MIGVETLWTAHLGMHSVPLDTRSWHWHHFKPVETLIGTILKELMGVGEAIVSRHKAKLVVKFCFEGF